MHIKHILYNLNNIHKLNLTLVYIFTWRSGLQSSNSTGEPTALRRTSSWGMSTSSESLPLTRWASATRPATRKTALTSRKQVWLWMQRRQLWLAFVIQILCPVSIDNVCVMIHGLCLPRYRLQAALLQGPRLLRGSKVHTSSCEPLRHCRIQRHPQLLSQRHTEGQ